MKHLCLLLVFLAFFTACEVQSDLKEGSSYQTNPVESTESAYRPGSSVPGNLDNPYDYSGELFSELLFSYYAEDSLSTDLSIIRNHVERIAHNSSSFRNIKPVFYEVPSLDRVAYFIDNKSTCLQSVISGTGISTNAQSSLLDFIDDYTALCANESSYEDFYNFIISYEAVIISDSSLLEYDKQVILITTSIARYSAAAKKKRPKKNTDPAWDLLVCTLYGSIESSTSSVAEAVTLALVAGIAENR